jgi:hypothetical protein
MTESDYIPGTCNIGPGEIRKRQFTAVVGAVLSLLAILSYSHSHISHMARTGIFIPLMVFSVGFIQSRRKFCLAFGLMGTFNFGKSRDIARVSSPEDRASDRKTALSILGQSALLALVLTGVVVALPL